jgi:hypothetical protein
MEDGKRTLYLEVLRALYGMLIAALLWYQTFKKDLEEIGFKFNSYDPCIANRWIERKQQTVRFHVDDLMSSHVNPVLNTRFLAWLNEKYGRLGVVKAVRGHVHDYLGMTFDFSKPGVVEVSMLDYIEKMIEEFPYPIKGKKSYPAPEDLFAEGKGDVIEEKRRIVFHRWVAKSLFSGKRARMDTQTATSLLCSRVKGPKEDDWRKLIHLLEYLNATRGDVLTLSADDLSVVKWYVDASFAVHPDFKSHTGATMSYG